MLKVPGKGPSQARIMLVGEAPGEDEEIAGEPFVGMAGKELRAQCKEAKIDVDACYITNVSKYRPPENDMSEWLTDKKTAVKRGFIEHKGRYAHPLVIEGIAELAREISDAKPDLIVGFGNTPLWALTGNYGISNWRGSELILDSGIHFVPTYHPAAILRQWANRPQVLLDLRYRVKRRLDNGFVTPEYKFNTQPTFLEVMEWIDEASKHGASVAGDIETAGGTTICLGLAKSAREAICIPFRNAGGRYWHPDDQREIIARLQQLGERVQWIGQNWNYDAQYLAEDFRWIKYADFDTYIAQSVLLPGTERALGYLSSMYCDHHVFWKEDAKDWGRVADFDRLFRYNCLDVCRDWEIAQVQRTALEHAGLMDQFQSRMKYSQTVLRMMRRGINRDAYRAEKMVKAVEEAIHEKELVIAEVAGRPVNFDSPKQVATLLYKDLGFKAFGKTGKSGVASTSDDSLKKLMEKSDGAAKICMPILEARSLRSLKSNFLEAELDPDGRFRSSFMATGTETFRLTSGGNAFHRGGPLQNVTDGKHTHSGRALPNLRSCIVPDYGRTIFNCDLERADLQVVAWEANDEQLKQMLREHVDIHTENAKDLWGVRTPTEQQRHFGKTFVHLTNYGGKGRTCAIKCNTTIHQADLMQRRWFEMHPGIQDWHRRTNAALLGTRTIYNAFGYRRIYFDRVEGMLPEALAWVPQSTVSILISLMQIEIEENVPEAELLLQVHDSIVGQYDPKVEEDVLSRIHHHSHIAVPYPDPLYIPLELATSSSSWGEVEKRSWPIHG